VYEGERALEVLLMQMGRQAERPHRMRWPHRILSVLQQTPPQGHVESTGSARRACALELSGTRRRVAAAPIPKKMALQGDPDLQADQLRETRLSVPVKQHAICLQKQDFAPNFD
jgi:hypothetical protein